MTNSQKAVQEKLDTLSKEELPREIFTTPMCQMEHVIFGNEHYLKGKILGFDTVCKSGNVLEYHQVKLFYPKIQDKISYGVLFGELYIDTTMTEIEREGLELLLSYSVSDPKRSHQIVNIQRHKNHNHLDGTFKILKDTENGQKMLDLLETKEYKAVAKMRTIGKFVDHKILISDYDLVTFDVILLSNEKFKKLTGQK